MSSNRRASVPAIGLRRSPRRRTKTPSVNELSKKYKISPRGKRRLEFQHEKHQEPLKDCTFYLDLENYRKTGSLKARIKELGGAVEEFLSKDISCVVTNKKDADSRCSPRSNSTPSPSLSIPSPFPGNTKSSSAKGSAIPSPLSADSCGTEQSGQTSAKHNMRGKALAAHAAITYTCGTSNVIANARNWGLQIVSLEKMLEKLERYDSILKKPTSKALVTGRVAKQGVKPKVRKLHPPFIKVEDHSRAYKPLVHELKDWPKIYFDGALGRGPFDPPKRDLEHDCREPAKTKRKNVEEDRNKKKGFCECCCVHYEDLDMHLHSDRHQAFSRDSSNYKSLDELIRRGPSLQDFLENMLLKHQQKEREKKEENRTEIPGSQNSVAVEAEEKTPSKQNNQEMIPVYQTPPDQGFKENEGCQTPINPSPERPVCRTSATNSTPERNCTDYDTPRKTSGRRIGKGSFEVKEAERRELRSSPRRSESKTNSPGEDASARTVGYFRERRVNLVKTSVKTASERVTNTRVRSSSLSPTVTCSKSDKYASSPASREDLEKSQSKRRKRVSPAQNVAKKSADAKMHTHEQGSSGEDGSKVNQQPKSSVFRCNMASCDEDSVVRTKLRPRRPYSDRGEVDLVKCKANSSDESRLELQHKNLGRTRLRQAGKENFCETFESTNQIADEQLKSNIDIETLEKKYSVDYLITHASRSQGESKQNTQGESPKSKNIRSARREKLPDCCDENEQLDESHEEMIQDLEHKVDMKSPRSTRDASVVKLKNSIMIREAPATESDMQKGKMTSLATEIQQESEIRMESRKRSRLRSATKESHHESCQEDGGHASAHVEMPTENEKENAVKSCEASGSKSLGQDIGMEGSMGSCRSSAASGNRGGLCDRKPNFDTSPETIPEDTQMESLEMSCLSAPSNGSISRPKRSGSPKTGEEKGEQKTRRRKQPCDKIVTRETKKSGKASSDQQETTIANANNDSVVRCTRSRVKSAPATMTQSPSDLDDKEKTRKASSSNSPRLAAEVKLGKKKVDSSVCPHSCVESKPQRKLLTSKNEVSETTEDIEVSQSTKSCFHDSKDSSQVEVKLSDCRKLCVNRKRPLRDVHSNSSDTESIQSSSGETSSKGPPAEDALSDDDENDLSSTPTLDHCPSPASSEKSGFSNETSAGSGRYSLRKHVEQDKCDSKLCNKTKLKHKIPDSPESYRERRERTVSTDFTSVKSKSRSPKQRSQSVQSFQTRTSKKKAKGGNKGQIKIQENTPCCGEAFHMKEFSSEADLRSTSGSPRSGPTHDKYSMGVSGMLSAGRNLQELAVDDVDKITDPSFSSDTIASLGDVSVTTVRGSPPRMKSADYCATSKYSGIQLLEGSPRIKKDYHSAAFLAKHGKKRSGVTRLFESDDEEEEDFYGFDVPQFLGSFSSEGEDLSYRINSIVESMNDGSDEATLGDTQDNDTIEEVKTSDEDTVVEKNIGREEESMVEKIEIGRKEDVGKGHFDGDVEIEQKKAARVLRKIRPTTSVEIHNSNLLDSRPSTAKTSIVDSIPEVDTDDFDQDDDVFSTVAGSTDGEDDEDDFAITSPFNISSWTRRLNSDNFQAEVSEQEEDSVTSSTNINWRRKRKSDDLQPEVGRPTKRRKSDVATEVDCSFQCSQKVTPVKTGAPKRLRSVRESNSEKGTSFMTEVDGSFLSKQEGPFFLSEPVPSGFQDSAMYETIEERVKIRRIMELSLKEYKNTQIVRQQKDRNMQSSAKEKDRQKFPSLKPLKGHSTIRTSPRARPINSSPSSFPSPLAGPFRKSRRATWTSDVNAFASPPPATSSSKGRQVRCLTPVSARTPSQHTLKEKRREKFPPLKPLKSVSSIRTSPRSRPINSSSSSSPSPLAGSSRKSRRATWIYDVNAFASPPLEKSHFKGRKVKCSTPVSAVTPPRHTLRSRRYYQDPEDSLPQKSRQKRDVFAFDE